MPMALQEYHRKRKFAGTPEPRGRANRPRKRKALSFVVQLHHARARHYDFRLEVEGVLHSWAIPKGPSFRPGEKRLAVEVEDHPLDYGGFEGTIPEGHYGAGHVAIFDEGTWSPEGDDPAADIKRGKLEFQLHGRRLRGRWTLVRTGKAASKPQWLLLKRSDEYAGDMEADDLLEGIPPPPENAPGASTAKGRRILAGRDEPRPAMDHGSSEGTKRTAKQARTRRGNGATAAIETLREAARSLAGKRRTGAVEFVPPMLTTAAKTAPAGDDWLHEWKWDGYRLIAASGTKPRIWSRNGLEWERRVPELAAALAKLGVDAMLDGELIAVNRKGYSDFNALQHALKSGDTSQLRYAAFDLLSIEGIDLTTAPLRERKGLLEQLLQGADPRLFYSGHVEGHGPEVFEAARKQGMEGIISKRAESTYRSGRGNDWLKVKAVETREFIVVGYTQPKGSRTGIGAFLLAQPKGRKLIYAGRVGSGLSNAVLAELPRQLQAIESKEPIVDLPPHTPLPPGKVHWVKPKMVVEVIFRGWGKEGLLRQASFHRLRADRTPTPELEQPASLPALSSPGRVVYPDIKATKQDVYDYYLEVADRVLAEVGGRLLSIVRCPEGIGGQHFFQKHAGPGFGEAVKRLQIRENDGDLKLYFYIEDLAGLMNLVQMNAIELHPWGSRIDDLEHPDRLVFDLDPDPSIGWNDIKRAARDVRDRLAQIGLPSYPRLSGGKGVHVVVPIKPKAGPSGDWDSVRRFCEAFAQTLAAQDPDRYVATMSKAKRQGRIFIDWLRNGRGATSVAGWSLRARAGAPAAMLLTWEELAGIRRPDRYSIKNAARQAIPAFIVELIENAPTLPQ